jgi:hypothetical protein
VSASSPFEPSYGPFDRPGQGSFWATGAGGETRTTEGLPVPTHAEPDRAALARSPQFREQPVA